MIERCAGAVDGDVEWPRDVRGQIAAATEQMAAVLGRDLVGIYLHGSLAMGGFNLRRSDLDLLVVTRNRLQSAARRSLSEAMIEVSRRPVPIEMSVMTLDHLRPWRHPAPYDFHFSESWRDRFVDALRTDDWWSDADRYDPDLAAHVTVTRARGVCLWGDPIQTTFPIVPAEHMRASLAADLVGSLQTISSNSVYTVLNCCRSLAYLEAGVVLSKAEGGFWALGSTPIAMAPVIRRAIEAYRSGDGTDDRFGDTDLVGFVEFAREALKPLLGAGRVKGSETCMD